MNVISQRVAAGAAFAIAPALIALGGANFAQAAPAAFAPAPSISAPGNTQMTDGQQQVQQVRYRYRHHRRHNPFNRNW